MTYRLLHTIASILNALPRSWSVSLGRFLGAALYLLFPIRKQVVWNNLNLALPELSENERRKIMRRSYQHFGVVLMDIIRILRFNRKSLESIIELKDTNLLDVEKKGRGIIIMTGHLGNMDLGGTVLSLFGYPIVAVAAPQRGWGGSFLESVRESTGAHIISKKASTMRMSRLVKTGHFLLLGADQDARRSGMCVTFFGRPSFRPRGGAVFALSTRVPILFMRCILKKNGHYLMDFAPIDTENLPQDREQATKAIMQRYMNLLEDAIRRNPEQYFWFHRMWKTSPRPSE